MAGMGSGAGGIEKNMEGLDAATFDPGDIGPRHGNGTVRWTGLPAQPTNTMVTNCVANRSEGEV